MDPYVSFKPCVHCQAVLSLVDLFAERQNFHCAMVRSRALEYWNARRQNARTPEGNQMVPTLDNVMPGELCVTIWQFQKSSFFCLDIENAQYPGHQ